jgi:hypothetical protein
MSKDSHFDEKLPHTEIKHIILEGTLRRSSFIANNISFSKTTNTYYYAE